MKKIIIILEIGLIAMIYFAISAFQEKDLTKPEKEIIRPVQTTTLTDWKTGNIRHYFGTIQGSQRVNLSFRVSGMLKRIAFDKGAFVKRGAVLATLDTRDFKTTLLQAQSVQAQAKAQYNDAQINFKRYENLYKQRAISKSQYDASKTQLEVSQSAVNTASAQVKAASDALKDTELRAPFDGVIAERMVENFQHITAQQPVFSLQDISTLEVVFNVPDNDMLLSSILTEMESKKANEKSFSLTARFETTPDRTFSLTLKEFSPQSDTRTNTYPVTAIMPQQKDVRLLPGMAVTVEVNFSYDKSQLLLKQTAGEYTVPSTAILNKGAENFLWRYEEGRVHCIPITVHSPLSNGFFKISALNNYKLNSGDIIVTAGVYFLREGQKVRLEQ